MSRVYKIRWNESDNQELKRVVRNYNAKIKRLEKKNPQLKNVLPEKTSVAQMKELIQTRQDLKRELNSLKRFSKRGAEEIVDVPDNDYNLKITKWQRTEMNRRASIINRKRAKRKKEIEETPLKSRGEELGYTRGQLGMGKAELVALNPINSFTPSMNRSDLREKFKVLQKESQTSYWTDRDMQHKHSYIEGLKKSYKEEDIKDIVKAIEDMDYKEFRKIFDSEDPHFEYASTEGLSKENEKGFVEALKTIWIPNKN